MPSEERHFYQETLLKKSTTNSTMSSSASSQSGSIINPSCTSPPETGATTPPHHPNNSEESLQPGSRPAKQNGIREVHHVTFAESLTEHGGTDQSEEESVIQENNKTVTMVTSCSRDIRSSGANGHVINDSESSHENQTSSFLSHNQPGPGLSPTTTTQVAPLAPIIKLQRSASTESHENPFLADGELSKKADYIISHSTISRTQLKIEDPDQSKKQAVMEDEIQMADGNVVHSAPPEQNRPNEINVKDQNGKLEEPIAPSSVEVVEKANASQPEPEQAEEVKVKNNPKCKCCTIM